MQGITAINFDQFIKSNFILTEKKRKKKRKKIDEKCGERG